MVKIFSPLSGPDPIAGAFREYGKQLFGDQTANAINNEKLYAAQRENTETDNLMRRIAGGGGAQAMTADPISQAILIGSGYDPSKFNSMALMGGATQFGAADPRTQNLQVGAGQSYDNTAGAFNAKLAETVRSNDLASADRRYGVDESQKTERDKFFFEPKAVINPDGSTGFARQGELPGSTFQPIISEADQKGTLLAQNWNNLPNLNPNQQEVLGALPGSAGGSRTPKNYIVTDPVTRQPKTFMTIDGVTDVQTGLPLPQGGYIGTVQGGAGDVGLTNSTMSGLQQNILANNKFKNLAQLTREYAEKDPNNFGIPGYVKGTVQDIQQLAGTLAQGLGYKGLQDAVDQVQADAVRNGVDPGLISGVFDPNLAGLQTLSDLLAYSAAEALAGQSGRSVSDRDVQAFKNIVGDPQSVFMSQAKYLAKLSQIERILDINQQTLSDAQKSGAVPQFTGSDGNAQPPPAPQGQTSTGAKWRIVQ
jgi:hypothetical protein